MNSFDAPVEQLGTQTARLVCVPIAISCTSKCDRCCFHMPAFYRVAVEARSASPDDCNAARRLARTSFIFGKVLCAN